MVAISAAVVKFHSLMAPLSFSADQHAGALAGAIMKAEGGKWKIISSWLSAAD